MPETQDELDAVVDVLTEGRDAIAELVAAFTEGGAPESVVAQDREFVSALSQAIDYLTTK